MGIRGHQICLQGNILDIDGTFLPKLIIHEGILELDPLDSPPLFHGPKAWGTGVSWSYSKLMEELESEPGAHNSKALSTKRVFSTVAHRMMLGGTGKLA